jgi:hypothetical protein
MIVLAAKAKDFDTINLLCVTSFELTGFGDKIL